MSSSQPSDWIDIRGLRLWAHVGVLESEQRLGQWFELDLRLGFSLAAAASSDDLALTLDYSTAIRALQRQSVGLRCRTLESWSELIFALLEELYGPVPMQLELRKCKAPVPGFTGMVAIRRSRRLV